MTGASPHTNLRSTGFNRRPHQEPLETPYKKLQALQNINLKIYYCKSVKYTELTSLTPKTGTQSHEHYNSERIETLWLLSRH